MSKEKKDETAGIPNKLFENDLDLPENAEASYSDEFKDEMQAYLDRIRPKPTDK